MTEKDRIRNERFKIAQLLILFFCVICIIIACVLFILSIEVIPYIFLAFFFVLGISEPILAAIRHGLNKGINAKPSSQSYSSSYASYSGASTSSKAQTPPPTMTPSPEGDTYGWEQEGEEAEYELIYKFDEYIQKNFPFVPLDLYKVPKPIFDKLKHSVDIEKKLDVNALIELALSMEKHLGYDQNKVIVKVKDSEPGERIAGTHERYAISFSTITINYSNVYNVYNVILIMAHEISHAFQQYYGHPTYNDDELESEKFTDALALYLGFTNIYKNGQKYKVNGHIHRLGYFSDNSLRKVDEIQSTRLIKEKPMREYKQKFDGIQNKASQTIEGIKIYLKTLENTISLINPEKPEYKTTVLYYKKKYLEADFLRGCELFVYNLIKYTEEEANERIKIIEKSLLELSEDIKTLEKLAD